MTRTFASRTLAALLAACLAAPALADKPEWAGGGKGGGKHEHKHRGHDDDRGGRRGDDRHELRAGRYFSEHDRAVAYGWYGQEVRGGKGCPPGLAKKNNGCLPPGQAKKYALGQPLPQGVVVYPVPQPVLVQLPPAPVGHKYVRVAADILLIAVGSSMVVDAITDLGRL